MLINGVQFRSGDVDWEDVRREMRSPLPDFETFNTLMGTKVTSSGLITIIGKYVVVITEHCDTDTVPEYDYTLIPRHAVIEIRYHTRKRR